MLTGHLHDFDVGANIVPVPYGAVPAILFACPGTAVRAAVLWLTPLQAETLVFAELGYRLGRLDHAQFEIDEVDVTIDVVFAFVGRTGALRLAGEPVAAVGDRADGAAASSRKLDAVPVHLKAASPPPCRFDDTSSVGATEKPAGLG